ncbi:hypothetical protein BDZ97DRAFT_1434893 [Flammula alnicola]|nr:hypothetical protein BDZ97DRAFT_1434893 [Flammula alnicola]
MVYVLMASLAVLSWEYILTSRDEFRHIWRYVHDLAILTRMAWLSWKQTAHYWREDNIYFLALLRDHCEKHQFLSRFWAALECRYPGYCLQAVLYVPHYSGLLLDGCS